MMLWFESERAIRGTPVTVEHPEWFLTKNGSQNQILYYGNEEARRYIFDLISNYAKNLDFSCYRQDFNLALTRYFEENDEENRRAITEIKHITGMYRLWDELLEKFIPMLNNHSKEALFQKILDGEMDWHFIKPLLPYADYITTQIEAAVVAGALPWEVLDILNDYYWDKDGYRRKEN